MDENNEWKDSFKKDIITFLQLMLKNENLIFKEDMTLDIENDTYIFQLEIKNLYNLYNKLTKETTLSEYYFRSQILKYWHLYQLRSFVLRNRELIATEAKSIDKMTNRMIGMLDDLFWRIPELQDENADGKLSSDTYKYVNSKLRSAEFNSNSESLTKGSCHLEHTTPRILLKHWVELACSYYTNDTDLLEKILEIAELNICTAVLKSEKSKEKNWLQIKKNENEKYDFSFVNDNSENSENTFYLYNSNKFKEDICTFIKDKLKTDNIDSIYFDFMLQLLAHFRQCPFCRYDGITVMIRNEKGVFIDFLESKLTIESVHNFKGNAI